ncbi:MAG: DUF1990 family protein [Solirubrobacteraceae bacterium]
MPRRPPASRRLATATRWPLGVVLTSWRYLWRTTPTRRLELAGSLRHDMPPALPADVDLEELQLPEDGCGPLMHRRYRVRVRGACYSAQELFTRIQADPDCVSPSEFASFQKVLGEKGRMRTGDEFVVRMAAPWDGPVRALDVTPTSHRFGTLEGHLEAGQVEFSAAQEGDLIVLTIESWARSGDRFSDLMFDHALLAKEIQVHMWVSYLERIINESGGTREGLLEVRTRRLESSELGNGPWPDSDREARRLNAVPDRPLNFDPHGDGPFTPDNGWEVDRYRQPLPPESPGDPEPGGSWEVARRLMSDYRFADPRMIVATYDPSRPLAQRDMLLEARFHLLRFRFAVRVGDVVDEARIVDGREARVWGWSYRTLMGHLEAGEMGYEVWKWLDGGEVEFRIHRFVRSAEVGNPVVRLGFRLLGRREQVRFAGRACERMAQLVELELEQSPVDIA